MNSRARVPAILGLIVLGYFALATLYAVRVPIWNAPDEPAHYNVIRSIAVDHQLPVLRPGDYDQEKLARLMHEHFPPGESIDSLRYESHQPPLYYLLAAPVFLATEHASLHARVVALRLVTTLIGALVILTTFRLARLIFPRSTAYPLAAAAFVAFVPMHLFMDAAIDNDALVELMLTLLLIVLVEDLIKPREGVNDLKAGLAAGLAALAKLDGGISAVLIVVGFTGSALLGSHRDRALRRVPVRVLRAGVIAALVSGWWFARNLLLYGLGDPFALRRHAQVVVGQPLTGGLTAAKMRDMLLTAFHSFWGQFGWMGIPYSDRTYDVLATLSLLVALGGALFGWRVIRYFWSLRHELGDKPSAGSRGQISAASITNRAIGGGLTGFPIDRAQAWALGLLLLDVLLVIVGVVFYNVRYLQPQGRYLFPSLPALAIFSTAGIGELFRDEHVGLILALAGVGLFGFCIISLFQVIGPAFAAAPS